MVLSEGSVALRAADDTDQEFLYQVYASTRQEELAATAWPAETMDAFLRDQFRLQHSHYHQYYPGAQFQVVLVDQVPVGRLYVHTTDQDTRVMDIALLPAFRRRGIGGGLLKDLMARADERGRSLSLHVEFNNPIRDYYRRLGFREKPLDGVYYFMERLPVEAP